MKIELKRPAAVQTADQWPESRPLPWLIDLSEWLRLDGHYPPAERSRILTSILDHGTLEHAAETGLIDPEDYALIESIYVASQPAIPYDDPMWDDADRWGPGPPLSQRIALTAAELAELEQDLQSVGLNQLALSSTLNYRNWRKSLGCDQPPPLSGGSPEADDMSQRLAEQARKITELEARLAAIPSDWNEYYNPF